MANARHLLLAITVSLSLSTGAADPPRGFACKPLLSVFCRNIHVGCAGVTRIPTTAFEVAVTGGVARITFGDAAAAVSGRISGHGDVVIWLEASRDWIRIEGDGRYSHRTYRDGRAAMSRGTCRRSAFHVD